jgi:hypothetical protein
LPRFDHCLLHQILRIRLAAALLAGKEEQSGNVAKHPPLPFSLFRHLICATAIHAISVAKAPPVGFFV